MINNTVFAIAYRRAATELMDAVASGSPSALIESAKRSASRAWCLAGNTIEEKLAGDLIDSIDSAKPLIMA